MMKLKLNQRYIRADIQIPAGAPIHLARQSFCSPIIHKRGRRPPMPHQRPFFTVNHGTKNDKGGGGQKNLAFKGEREAQEEPLKNRSLLVSRLSVNAEGYWEFSKGLVGHCFLQCRAREWQAHECPRRCKGNHSDKRNQPSNALGCPIAPSTSADPATPAILSY